MASRAILASKIQNFSQGSMPPDPLNGRAFGVPFKTHFAKGASFSDPGPSINPLPCPEYKDERQNSGEGPSSTIYAL